MTAPTESADLTGGMCHLQGTAQGTGHWHQAGPTWDASAPWRSLCSQLLFQPRVLCSELGLPPPHLTHTHLEPPRPPTPLLAVPSLAPPEEAIIENGPSDSIRIQSPRENRGGGRGGRGAGRGEPPTPPLPVPQGPAAPAGVEGVRRGQSSTATQCCL